MTEKGEKNKTNTVIRNWKPNSGGKILQNVNKFDLHNIKLHIKHFFFLFMEVKPHKHLWTAYKNMPSLNVGR